MPAFGAPQSASVKSFNVNLNINAGTYDITTCINGDVYVESFAIYCPLNVGGLTSVEIKTDDTTAQVFLTAAEGAVANLTQKKLVKAGNMPMYLTPNTKIRYTVVGNGNAGNLILALNFSSVGGGALL